MLRAMKHLAVRFLSIAALVTALVTLVAQPAMAAQIRRAWAASLTGAVAGTATLLLYPDSSGSVSVDLRGLKPSTTYSQMIYKGSCARPITLVPLPTVRTSTTGGVRRTLVVPARSGVAIWSVGATGTVAYRIASGTWSKCATLHYEVATRVAVSKYGIDLPIILQPNSNYPYCNVAMYVPELSQPGEAGPTMIYAHARTGMFLPLLTASKVNNGRAMIGMIVRVWTSNSKLYTYQVTSVVRHVDISRWPSNDFTSERLWLQTSEGPRGTRNKLFVIAKRISVANATYAAAHPRPRIVLCH
jgi:sortase (surface protein transpeptidase)